MLTIEKNIVPLIEQQFPALYREEGQLFITFVKAYYEWLESNLQELVFASTTGFDVGDTITQGDTTGTIIAKFGTRYIIQLSEFDAFRCNTFCNDLTPATSSSGATTSISQERKYNAAYYARRLAEIRDIDNTLDSFILQFKKKYLPNIQFTTASNKELFIKNSLDFYRAKGTERAVDLFFKLIHGFEARVYYPGDDLFRLSDNEWVNVTYLEIQPSDTNINMVGQIVYGTITGASAFAERLVRVKKGGKFINVLYLSNLNGNFQTGENVYTKDLDTNVTSKVIGSLTSLEIVSSSNGFVTGEDLYIENGSGKKGFARVSNTETFLGTVSFDLTEGGWGYSSNAVVIGSDRVLTLSNITNANTDYYNLNDTFQQFETVNQDLLSLTITGNDIEVGVNAEAYDSTANLVAEGTVVFSNTSTLVINYDSTTANTLLFSNVATVNASSTEANVDSSSDASATANVMAIASNSTITYTSNDDITLAQGDVLYQLGSINGVDRVIANGVVQRTFTEFDPVTVKYVNFTADIGTFRTDLPFYRKSDDAEFSITKISNTSVGIINPVNTFYTSGEIYGSESGVTATLAGSFSFEQEASFVTSTFEEQQTLVDFINTDVIDQTVNTAAVIDSESAYANVISDYTAFSNVTIGSLQTIVQTGPGIGYPIDPFFIVYDPLIHGLERYDFQIEYADSGKNFVIGEIIEGGTSGARARIFLHDRTNRIIRATRLTVADDFTGSDDFVVGETFTGEGTNISSTISRVFELRREPRTGVNADILSESFSGAGFASELSVTSSGFGYEDGESVILKSLANPNKEITATIRLGQQGIGQGYHLNRKSFLSSDKYIHDSDFYQEYSYQVLTSLPFQTYRDTLIKVLHVAGTKPFGSYVGTTQASIGITLDSTTESS